MRAIPIIPMLPAKEVRIVLPFLVSRFFIESEMAVANDIEVFCLSALRAFLSFFI